jgi:hypothetical protein
LNERARGARTTVGPAALVAPSPIRPSRAVVLALGAGLRQALNRHRLHHAAFAIKALANALLGILDALASRPS